MYLLGPLDVENKVIVTEAVQSLNSTLSIFFPFVTDEGETSGLSSYLVLIETNDQIEEILI